MMAPEDGSWLSTPGPYQSLVKSLCTSDHTLRKRDMKVTARGVLWPGCVPRLVVLEVQGETIQHHLETTDPKQLANHFECRQRENPPGQRTIYILEGLSPAFIAVLGGYFMMHPSFFADHDRVSRAGVNHRGEENLLPSIAAGKDHVCLKYSELFTLPGNLGQDFRIRCAEIGRQIAATRTYGEFSKVSMLSRKCSFWNSQAHATNGWDSVILCDPPLRTVNKVTGFGTTRVDNTPWEGGYVDFLPQKDQTEYLTGPPRTSMLDDLCYYLQSHSRYLTLQDYQAPTFS